ncbi:hypothetical protein ITQ84_09835 [Pediococcus pentosaceus]|uniref:hypothetical protein n=1 Tax=Pediococcus pentosaceus TaxID=1255 RepID=UPI0018A18CDE|nr:hypothetical protein [Pediococcus pentosaceus]MBF7140631.1 hypothetical protein [Pediococcus pentosaceus]
MINKVLVGFNWLAGGMLSVAFLLAALMPTEFFNQEDWAKPVILLVMLFGLLLIINGIRRVVNDISDRTYRWCLYIVVALIVIAQAWVALHFIDAARADLYFVRNQAIALAQGSHKWNYYFKVYPNNVNSALFEGALLKVLLGWGIKMPWTILNFFRFVWIDTGLLSGLVMLQHWKHARASSLLFMLTWLLSVPVYTYGLFPYNDALVMPLILNVSALGWLFINKNSCQRWLAGIGTWILLSMGYVMKSNLIVFLIAAFMTAIFASISKKVDWKLAIGWLLGSLITLFLLSSFMTNTAKSKGYVKNTNLATPVTSWIAMSLNPDKQGQYYGRDFYSIRDTKTQVAKKKKAAASIKTRVKKLGKTGLAYHFYQKFGVFYSHGDFDAINLTSQWVKAPSSYIQRQRHYKFWALMLTQSWYLALLVGSIWQLFAQRTHLLITSMLSLAILGLTVFHVLIWEVEPRYSLPLLPIIMLLGCEGWTTIPAVTLNLNRRMIVSWVMALGITVSMFNIAQMSQKVTIKQISLATQGNGAYFTPTTLAIKNNYNFKVPLHGLKSNQLVLQTDSKNQVTIIVRSNGKVVKRVAGHANTVQQINYPTFNAKRLDVTITNHGRTPIKYNSGLVHYSAFTGKITKKMHMNMRWGVNRVFNQKDATKVQHLTRYKTIIQMSFFYLFLVLVSIWYRPSSELNTRKSGFLK